ncbi:hypothetical protein [Coleofasciculus sp. FACHB-SPT9]|uniref:hypothetical protein n=1 Tax=Cyanophyceae TaxID=3028117 RepID=UPI00168237EE|nr:hypothetical protein [Coleofasciculus sp. FACHB-SPT9]MBD1890743.1 hypothetical protein [Coleofasciculus sp. FACHB-SPT9]
MIEIKPSIQHKSTCPHSGTLLNPQGILWQGMHICVKSKCDSCNTEIIEDLEVGHAVTFPYQIDLAKGDVFGNESCKYWLGQKLLYSLQNPQSEEIAISKEVFKQHQRVIILNCIDYLYGHSLLKLLNVQRYLNHYPDCGLIVIVPKFLRWMVPEGVTEIWTVNIPLQRGQCYYPKFDQFISEESKRFDKIYVSKAYSHPSQFDISKFTRVPTHSFDKDSNQITFIWRDDRIWCNPLLFKTLRKLKMVDIALKLQNERVQKLFLKIHSKVPSAKFTIAGLGRKTQFPDWIEDLRVNKFNSDTERQMCQVYSQSRLVIGVHGSNMLLPSGHAGMTLDLMPEERWGNVAQDILYQETEPRLAAFRYRYVSLQTPLDEIGAIASSMLLHYSEYKQNMTADK